MVCTSFCLWVIPASTVFAEAVFVLVESPPWLTSNACAPKPLALGVGRIRFSLEVSHSRMMVE